MVFRDKKNVNFFCVCCVSLVKSRVDVYFVLRNCLFSSFFLKGVSDRVGKTLNVTWAISRCVAMADRVGSIRVRVRWWGGPYIYFIIGLLAGSHKGRRGEGGGHSSFYCLDPLRSIRPPSSKYLLMASWAVVSSFARSIKSKKKHSSYFKLGLLSYEMWYLFSFISV